MLEIFIEVIDITQFSKSTLGWKVQRHFLFNIRKLYLILKKRIPKSNVLELSHLNSNIEKVNVPKELESAAIMETLMLHHLTH